MNMGFDIRPVGRGRAVAYRASHQDALTFAKTRAQIDNRAMVIVDVATNRELETVAVDGSVSLAPDGHNG